MKKSAAGLCLAAALVCLLYVLLHSHDTHKNRETTDRQQKQLEHLSIETTPPPSQKASPTKRESQRDMKKIPGYIDVTVTSKELSLACQSCSLVGSSGHLLSEKAGEEIDKADCIFRMNQAPVRGFEKDVGRRTTVRVLNHVCPVLSHKPTQHQLFQLETSDVAVVWAPPKRLPLILTRLKQIAHDFPHMRVYLITAQKMKNLDELFAKETGRDRVKSGSWLTTGWFTFDLVLRACDQVSVYGLPPANYCS
eukprot:m.63886 g.63886  ORF g.63886 m.63886 type:complete len:251 (+) comp35198_c0_seq2:93-845(+)